MRQPRCSVERRPNAGGRLPNVRAHVAEAGMATVELAVATLGIGVLTVVAALLISVGLLQVRLYETAAEVARQEARGDAAAVARSMADRPVGAQVSVTRGSMVTVVVRLDARPWGSWLPAAPLSASASVLAEEG